MTVECARRCRLKKGLAVALLVGAVGLSAVGEVAKPAFLEVLQCEFGRGVVVGRYAWQVNVFQADAGDVNDGFAGGDQLVIELCIAYARNDAVALQPGGRCRASSRPFSSASNCQFPALSP